MIEFKYVYYNKIETILGFLKECEGRHVQQAVFSTFHNGMTQICFTEKAIRSTIQVTS